MEGDLDYNTASIEELVDFCRASAHRALPGSSHVIRLSQTTVAKFGTGVRQAEADNQEVAFRLLNPHIVRIPQVFRFLKHQIGPDTEEGYLIMEYIDGQAPKPDSYIDLTTRLLPILKQFRTIQSDIPGALGGGPAYGIFWENDFPKFSSRDEFDAWINKRLLNQRNSILGQSLSICHMDLAPRNILELPDRSICLLDWANAGFYPPVFEEVILRLQPAYNQEITFYESLAKSIFEDEAQLGCVLMVWNNEQRLYL